LEDQSKERKKLVGGSLDRSFNVLRGTVPGVDFQWLTSEQTNQGPSESPGTVCTWNKNTEGSTVSKV